MCGCRAVRARAAFQFRFPVRAKILIPFDAAERFSPSFSFLPTHIHIRPSVFRSPSFSFVCLSRRKRSAMRTILDDNFDPLVEALEKRRFHRRRIARSAGVEKGNSSNCLEMAGPILVRHTCSLFGFLCISTWRNKRADNGRYV